MATQPPSLFQSAFAPPSDYGIEAQGIDRKRLIAQELFKQSFQSPQGQMVSGHYVKSSPLEFLAQALRGYVGQQQLSDLDNQQLDLTRRYQAQNAQDVQDYLGAAKGTPAQTIPGEITPESQGNNPSAYTPQTQAPDTVIPAAGPDRNKMLAIALRSQNPMLQASGGKMLESQVNMAQLQDILGNQGAGGQGGGTPSTQGLGAYGVNPTAMALMMQGGPMEKIGQAIQESSKPIPLREGDLVTRDAQGNFKSAYSQPKVGVNQIVQRDAQGNPIGTQLLPGAASAISQSAAAQEGPKLIKVDAANGPPRLMTNEQANALATGNNPVPQSAAERGMASQISAPMGADPLAIQREISRTQASLQSVKDPASQQALQGYISDLQQQAQRLPQSAQPPGIALQTPGAQKFSESQAQNASDYSKSLNDRVSQGADLNMRMQESLKALDKFNSGGGAATRAQVAQAVQAMGAPAFIVNGIAGGDLGSMQEFNKLAVQQAMEQLKQSMGGAGRIAQAEFKVFQANNPNISTDPTAIRKIFDFNTRVYNRDLSEQNAFQDSQKQGNNPANFQPYWARQQSLLGYTNPNLSAQNSPPKPTQGMVRNGYVYLGGEPSDKNSWRKQ